jgi:5-oxoprolinase (ATP-hydrolysing)
MRFLKAMRANILSDHRRTAPFGLAGGGDGATGINCIDRADGGSEILPGVGSADMSAGDVFTIETPGGGGYGAPN